MRPLTYRQRLFVEFYLGKSAGCAADAARRAGYASPHPGGQKLLKKAAVRAAIDARLTSAAMASSEVLARITDVASADLTKFIDVKTAGECKLDLKLIKSMGLGHLIRRVRIRKDGTQEIELESRLPALFKLGDHYNLWDGKGDRPLTMVNVAMYLKERDEQLRRDRAGGKPAGEVPGPTGAIQ